MNKVYLGLGGNLGDREANLRKATQLIDLKVGKVLTTSSLYETKAWGIENQPDFLNQVLLVETALSPQLTLQTILNIELEMGRIRRQKWHTRLIDIDILFYKNWIVREANLIIPHSFLQARNFVLAPLFEIAPDLIHPLLQKTVSELYFECPDELKVFILKPA